MEKALLIFIRLKHNKNITHATPRTFGPESARNKTKPVNHSEEHEELKNLALSAGALVEDIIDHSQNDINPKFYISSGKLEEVKTLVNHKTHDLIVFDNDLTPAQQNNLEKMLGTKILDRTALILDIFAQRAQSSEGKLQVELAQLNYILPRLRGKGIELSRLGGGIGTRGPGEQKLEVDRRKIRKRISQLENRINKIEIQRQTQRKKREQNRIFQVSLVGYTNSGKSTLLNKLTKSDVLVKNMLFSTLDSTTRKIKIPEIDEILISDTVGFIEKLPHQLVAAFKSTLEEVRKSDLLLHIVDSSSINFEKNIESVTKVLKEISVINKPLEIVFNKTDILSPGELKKLKLKYKNAIYISALKNTGLENLYERIKNTVDKKRVEVSLKIPYDNQDIISFIYRNCKILEKKYLEDGIYLVIYANPEIMDKIKKFLCRKNSIKKPAKNTSL